MQVLAHTTSDYLLLSVHDGFATLAWRLVFSGPVWTTTNISKTFLKNERVSVSSD